MGTLTNSVFQALMGWIRAVALEIWNTLSSPEGTTLMGWVGTHWKELAAGLCAAGMIIDLMVYLFRWQPYRVWRSRRRRRAEQEETPETKTYGTADAQAVPLTTAAAELAPSLIRQAQREMEKKAEKSGRMAGISGAASERRRSRRKDVARYVDSAYGDDGEAERTDRPRDLEPRETDRCSGFPPETQTAAGFPDETDCETGSSGLTEKFEQAIRPRRRRIRTMLSDRQDQDTETPDQLIDRNEAYRTPVYPRSWTGGESK